MPPQPERPNLGRVHDPERDRAADGEPEETWDQWFGRTYGSARGKRFVLIWAIAVAVAVTALFFSGNSQLFSR